MIKDVTPEEIKKVKIVSVQGFNSRWNWRKFRFEQTMFYLFCENGIFEYYPDKTT